MYTAPTMNTRGERLLTFPAAVQAQADMTPDAPAIVSAEETVTYRELRSQMNRVANTLLKRAVTRQQRIGLYLRRGEASAQTLQLLLGTLMVAAAVPLDAAPTFPSDRLASMMLDAGVDLVLTHSSSAPTLRRALARISRPVSVVCLDEVREEVERAGDGAPPEAVLAREEDLAYILFTSGTSAGKPKGVLVGQRSLAHFARTQNALLGISPGDRSTQFFALTFDASLSDLSQLAAGATLYPLPPNALLGGHALLHFLRDHALTVATFIPSLWNTLPSYDLPALRILVLGGEVCPASLVQKTARPGLRIFNAWGLTESTVAATLGECANDGLPPPIGRAIPGVEVSVRDQHLRRVPPESEGHICLSGACLAWGYTDEALTRERFVPDPELPGRTLFLSNDLGKMDAAGTVWFLGRLDGARRWKVSGKVVSLDEVEGRVLQEPGVAEGAVDHFDGRIVAYIALHPAVLSLPTDEAEAARERKERELRLRLDLSLRQHLPPHLRPKGYALLARLPRTSSGKVDRTTLRDQVPVTWLVQDHASDGVEASSAVERALAQIIAEFLTEDRQQEASARRALWCEGDEAGAEREEELRVVGWQEINMARTPTEMGIESVRAPDYVLTVAERLGVEIENREIFCPLATTASAIEFHLAQRAEVADAGTPGKGA